MERTIKKAWEYGWHEIAPLDVARELVRLRPDAALPPVTSAIARAAGAWRCNERESYVGWASIAYHLGYRGGINPTT